MGNDYIGCDGVGEQIGESWLGRELAAGVEDWGLVRLCAVTERDKDIAGRRFMPYLWWKDKGYSQVEEGWEGGMGSKLCQCRRECMSDNCYCRTKRK
jgi:hypothetical protein